jgi:hypothetical protein
VVVETPNRKFDAAIEREEAKRTAGCAPLLKLQKVFLILYEG